MVAVILDFFSHDWLSGRGGVAREYLWIDAVTSMDVKSSCSKRRRAHAFSFRPGVIREGVSSKTPPRIRRSPGGE